MNGLQTFQRTFGILQTCKGIGLPIKLVSTYLSLYHQSLFMPFPFVTLWFYFTPPDDFSSHIPNLFLVLFTLPVFSKLVFDHPGCNSWVVQFKADAQKARSEKQAAAQATGKLNHIDFSSSKAAPTARKSRFQPYGVPPIVKEKKTRWG